MAQTDWDCDDVLAWDFDDPLGRIKGESPAANQALKVYARMGPKRGLRAVLAIFERQAADHAADPVKTPDPPPTKSWHTLSTWNRRYHWQDRVARFDILEAEKTDLLWEERKRERQEQAWHMGSDLLAKAATFLEELPRFVRTSVDRTRRKGPNGEEVIVEVVTVGLNASLSQIAGALRTGVDLLSLATDQPTDNIGLQGAALDAAINKELRELANLEREAGLLPED